VSRTAPESLASLILERALELGFDDAAIVPAEEPAHYGALREWLDAGMHGEMAYMARHAELRRHPGGVLPGARSVVAVSMSHRPEGDGGEAGGVARYARGADYHKLVRKRLAQLGELVREELGASGVPGAETRACVDSAPILERDLAVRAGLGWFGKSANVISQRLGSYLFLGELLVTAELPEVSRAAPDRCGTCTACIAACPTGAIVAPYRVDARRCISYLTIELRGSIPRELRAAIGDHLFGCDICQIVCPWNRKAPALREAAFRPRTEVAGLSAVELLGMDATRFEVISRGSPIRRTGRDAMARNAAVVLGNSCDERAVPALIAALEGDRSHLVRGHAAWALGRIGGREARAGLERAREREGDRSVREELEAALKE
jgi:epoxyqueuosine reductase